MAFQDTAGTIILDAVLTDVGRRHMTQGTFKVSKFALGDDEVDYFLGDTATGEYQILDGAATGGIFHENMLPVLEAHAAMNSPINHGLIDYTREDMFWLPMLKMNQMVERSVKSIQDRVFVSVNEETTKALKTHLDIKEQILENNEVYSTMMVVESGIDSLDIPSTPINRERYIDNIDLFDSYYLAYTDNRLVDKILISDPDAHYLNDTDGRLYQRLGPLVEKCSTSLDSGFDNYDTTIITTVQGKINTHAAAADTALSPIRGIKSAVAAINFKLVPELSTNSNGAADVRYSKLGLTSRNLFGGSQKYDYIDTTIRFEGCASKATLTIPIRIIRYAGT